MLPVSSLVAFGIALSLAAGAPGPSIGALVARVLTRGFREVLPFLLAMWLGEAIWLTVAITGLATIAARLAILFTFFKLLGVAYLLFLAWRMWKAAGDATPSLVPDAQSAWQMFMAGLTVTLGNPKIAVFYLALLPSLVDLSRITVGAWAELTLIMVLVLVGIDLGWSAAAVRTRRLLMNRRSRLVANRVSATVMAAAAVGIAIH
jgi:threonine/homoserine/homoserine lactone efflux protein